MKKILITGASGFVGTGLANAFLKQGEMVVGTGTSKKHPSIDDSDRFLWVSADTTCEGVWQDHVHSSEVIINLAGRTIFNYWTKKYKQSIYDSRILTTRHIVNAMDTNTDQLLLTTSAVGVYGDCADQVLLETPPPGDGFLSKVCTDWENQALEASKKGARVCVMRFGVVLGDQGALAKMVPVFKLGAGGPLGDGAQWFPWIHIKDIESGIKFLIDQKDTQGIFNFTAPNSVRQKEFAKILGKTLHRPAFFPTPGFMVKAVMGELGKALLESQRAIPDRLTRAGYPFLFNRLEQALADILGK